jgi:hypothetical protein
MDRRAYQPARSAVRTGVYKLTATINHSPSGNPAQLDEMFGFAESTPIQITDPVIESN